MTTVAMSAGMLSSALALGGTGGFRAPMAVVVIGGLIASTALSLVFVPVVFTVTDDLGRLLRRRLGSLAGRADDRPEGVETQGVPRGGGGRFHVGHGPSPDTGGRPR